MKNILLHFLSAVIFLTAQSQSAIRDEVTIAPGNQPQVSKDAKGVIRIVYGQGDKIFCSTSVDKGISFSGPVLVGTVPLMHLGMSRGPQLASSTNHSVITAIDKSGDIHCFRLDHASNKWTSMGIVNDLKGSAPEGLMGLTADNSDHFYAVWLDIRTGKHNQIYFADLLAKADRWSKNRLVYRSPDGHVCECCKPTIAVNGSLVAIMFRNWLKGSRDLHVIKSHNRGASFSTAEKLGIDTWKLNGCPMDGGGIAISSSAKIKTTWQCKGNIYYCEPGLPEVYIGQGRSSTISAVGDEQAIAFETRDTLKVITMKDKKTNIVGNGSFLKMVNLDNNSILCVWEQNNKIICKEM
ncbi:MAG: hypothetical protein QM802_02610 [Agriterribacter sp.]